jgi:hypothetical protein
VKKIEERFKRQRSILSLMVRINFMIEQVRGEVIALRQVPFAAECSGHPDKLGPH